ncbi:MAG: hypothetical protein KGI93_07675 [Acidobacteriota bacterium]|nr:hypothetical protein [Acidobacteriota bacterium]
MATDTGPSDLAVESVAPPPGDPPAAPQLRMYPRRFSFVYAVLAAAAVAAVAGLVLAILSTGVVGAGPAWSTWKPSGGGLGAAKQIADEVGRTYRLPNGDQLVDVLAKAPSVSGTSGSTIPLHYIVETGPSGQKANKEVQISSSNAVSYELCGLGASCSIATGKPTVARGTLVRREILELALYTFKYVGGVDNVIAFMPPPAGSQPQYVVYLQKSDVASELKQPLDETLGAKVPLPATIPAREVHLVDSVTEPRLFKYGVTQSQTGDTILVLTPLPA